MQDKKGRELIPETHRVCRRGDGSIYGIPAGKKCRKGSEDYKTTYRIKRLNEKRDTLAKRLVNYMEGTRPDGVGNFMEHPDEKALRVIDSVRGKVGEIDKAINQLEGRNPNERRWVEGDPYGLGRYSNFSSKARRNYENEIISNAIAHGKKGNNAVIVAGGEGSKKMSLAEKKLGKSKGFVVVDPEHIKGLDPVMRVGQALGVKNASAMAHSNAKRVTNEIFTTARDKGLNMIVNVTGSKVDSHIERIRDLRGRGYRVSVLAYHINPREGIARAIARAEGLGRYTPLRFIRRSHRSVPNNFEKMSKAADNAIMFDVGRGRNLVQYQGGAMVGPISKELQEFRSVFGSPGQPEVAQTPTPIATAKTAPIVP